MLKDLFLGLHNSILLYFYIYYHKNELKNYLPKVSVAGVVVARVVVVVAIVVVVPVVFD